MKYHTMNIGIHFSMERHLKNSGFKDIEIYATGGWHLSMAQMLGLWLKRSSIKDTKGIKKKLLTHIVSYSMRKSILCVHR